MSEEPGATPGGAVEVEGSAESLDPVGESAQPTAVKVGTADAVVEDLDNKTGRVMVGTHHEPSCSGVFVTVRQPFGDDVVGRGLKLLGQSRPNVDAQVDGHGRAYGQRFESLGQPAFGQHCWVESVGELADLLQAGGELVDRYVDQRRALLGGLPDSTEREEDSGEPLLGTVVKVALDALTLGVGDLEEPRAGGA